MKWKFCEFCYINGHCENQDRGHKCECYGKKLEDKCERLEKQLKIAVEALKVYSEEKTWDCCIKNCCAYVTSYQADQALKQIKELEQDERI